MNCKYALLIIVLALSVSLASIPETRTLANSPARAAGATVEYTLMTGGDTGKLVFVGCV